MKKYNFIEEGWFNKKPNDDIDYDPPTGDIKQYIETRIVPRIEQQARQLVLNYLLTKYPQTKKLNPTFGGYFNNINGTIDLIDPERQMYLCELFNYIDFKPKSRYFGEYVTCGIYVMFNLQGMFKITNVTIGFDTQHKY